MPRVHGVRERRHQPIWDCVLRSTGAPTPALQQRKTLFGNAPVGDTAVTNMQNSGQLASDQTYVALALRCWMYFDGPNHRDLYQQVSSQLYFTFGLGDKPQFAAPAWYFPGGGGVYGVDTVSSVLSNGYPSQEAILKLARPIVVPVRQNIAVVAEFFPVGSTNVVSTINGSTEDQMIIMFLIDGLQTRDVQ